MKNVENVWNFNHMQLYVYVSRVILKSIKKQIYKKIFSFLDVTECSTFIYIRREIVFRIQNNEVISYRL